MASITEDAREQAVPDTLAEPGYEISLGPNTSYDSPAAERDTAANYRDVVLTRRPRSAVERLNPH